MNTAERYATTLALSQVDEEHIDEVYQIISQMKPKYRGLFIKIWVGASKKRLEIINALNTKKLQDKKPLDRPKVKGLG